MARVERSALVNFSSSQMFDLVNDFESYPQFMYGCVGAELLAKGENWLDAKLHLSRGGIKQSFSTHNELVPSSEIKMTLIEGPFSEFVGQWRFKSLADDACKVEFEISFEMKNKLLGLAVAKLLENIASEQVNSVCQRAKVVYAR